MCVYGRPEPVEMWGEQADVWGFRPCLSGRPGSCYRLVTCITGAGRTIAINLKGSNK